MLTNRLMLLMVTLCIVGGIFYLQGQAEVICFDVAQGNCVVIGSTDPKERALPCLIDAGCKSYTFRGKSFNAEQVDRIVAALERFAKITNQDVYNIIISHPDEDHYNLLPAIVKSCRTRGLEPYKIILGGVRALYNKVFRDFLDDLTAKVEESSSSDGDSDHSHSSFDVDDESPSSSEDESDNRRSEESGSSSGYSDEDDETVEADDDQGPQLIYLTEKGQTKKMFPVQEDTNLTYGILPALPAKTEAEKNDGSLAVLIEYEGLSFLVSGDATNATTEHILRYYPHLNVHGLHASHHGGESDGSNSSRWLRKLSPDMMVFSSGINQMYRHPRGSILYRASKYMPQLNGSYHALYSGTTQKNDFEDEYFRAIGASGYGLSVTQQNIFGTLGQGTITFVMDREDATLRRPKCSLGLITYPDAKSCVLVSLLKSPTNILPLESLVTVDLSRLGIDDDILVDKDRIRRLLIALKKDAGSLNYLFVQDNAINRPLTITHMEELLDARRYIKVLDMRNNGLSPDSKKRLQKKASKRRACKV